MIDTDISSEALAQDGKQPGAAAVEAARKVDNVRPAGTWDEEAASIEDIAAIIQAAIDTEKAAIKAERDYWKQLSNKAGEDNVVLSRQRDQVRAAVRELLVTGQQWEEAGIALITATRKDSPIPEEISCAAMVAEANWRASLDKHAALLGSSEAES